MDYGVSGDDRTIVHGKSQSVGTEVLMCASLLMVGYAQSTSVFLNPYRLAILRDANIWHLWAPHDTRYIFSSDVSDCDWRWSYTQKWYSAMLIPLFVGSYLIIQYYIYDACIAHVLIRKQYQNKVINTACIMMVLLYVFVTAKTIEPVACTEWEDGSKTMNADPNIGVHGLGATVSLRMLDGASRIFFFIFYGVGIPVVLFSMLYKAKLNHTMGSVMTKENLGGYMGYL